MSFPQGMKRAAAMVVLRCNEHLLLLLRAKPPNQNTFVPVGGKVDPYEDPYQTALRETFEETGIALQHLRYAGSLVETSPVNYNWWCNVYLADIPWQNPPLCDEGVLQWIPFQELATIPTPPTDWHIYQYIARGQPFAMRAIYDEELNLLEMTEELEGVRLVG